MHRRLFLTLLIFAVSATCRADNVKDLKEAWKAAAAQADVWGARSHAERLGELGTAEAAEALIDLFDSAIKAKVRDVTTVALVNTLRGGLTVCDNEEARGTLLEAFGAKRTHPLHRMNLVWSMNACGVAGTAALCEALADPSYGVRLKRSLLEYLSDPPEERFTQAVDGLVASLAANESPVRDQTLVALTEMTGHDAEPEGWPALWESLQPFDIKNNAGDVAFPAALASSPSICGKPLLEREIIVILDTSTSMADKDPLSLRERVEEDLPDSIADDIESLEALGLPRGRLDRAVAHLGELIEDLPDDAILNMVSMGWGSSMWSKRAQRMTNKSKKSALKWLAGRSAQGLTELEAAFEKALATASDDAIILVLTDGLPTDREGRYLDEDTWLDLRDRVEAMNGLRRLPVYTIIYGPYDENVRIIDYWDQGWPLWR